MLRSHLLRSRRGGAKRKPDRAQPQEKSGGTFRRSDHPVCASLHSAHPPLLFKEGKLRGAPPLVTVVTEEGPERPFDGASAGADAAHQFLLPLLQALSQLAKLG